MKCYISKAICGAYHAIALVIVATASTTGCAPEHISSEPHNPVPVTWVSTPFPVDSCPVREEIRDHGEFQFPRDGGVLLKVFCGGNLLAATLR
jgi:hypothetical protein